MPHGRTGVTELRGNIAPPNVYPDAQSRLKIGPNNKINSLLFMKFKKIRKICMILIFGHRSSVALICHGRVGVGVGASGLDCNDTTKERQDKVASLSPCYDGSVGRAVSK